MTDKELNVVLREMARSQGLCDSWYGKWSDDDTIDECLDRFVRGFDFCEEHDYPRLDFIVRNFRAEDLHRHNIFVNEEIDIDHKASGYIVCLGSCSGRISLTGHIAVTIYLRHTSSIEVEASDGAWVSIVRYDQSECYAVNDELSRVKIYNRTSIK